MNVLGMGPMELMLIVVLALIVFGPAKLPEIMGQIGRAISDFRRATSELSDEFNRTIQTELQETRAIVDETRQVMQETTSAVREAHTAVGEASAVVKTLPSPTRIADAPTTATVAQPVVNSTEAQPGRQRHRGTAGRQWHRGTGGNRDHQRADRIGNADGGHQPVELGDRHATEPVAEPEPVPDPEPVVEDETPKRERPTAARDELVPPY